MALQNTHNSGINPPASRLRTFRDINERHHQFCSEQADLMEQRMADQKVLRVAMNDLESEWVRQVPVYYQKSFAHALEIAANNKKYFVEEAAKVFQTEFSKKGGVAPKPDALQKLILEIVQRKPSITEPELMRELENRKLQGIVSDIDNDGGFIEFKNSDQQFKRARISGLKDRLSRAKKKLAQE